MAGRIRPLILRHPPRSRDFSSHCSFGFPRRDWSLCLKGRTHRSARFWGISPTPLRPCAVSSPKSLRSTVNRQPAGTGRAQIRSSIAPNRRRARCRERKPLRIEGIPPNQGVTGWRRGWESNPRIKVLQTSALPLGYRAGIWGFPKQTV